MEPIKKPVDMTRESYWFWLLDSKTRSPPFFGHCCCHLWTIRLEVERMAFLKPLLKALSAEY